MITLRTVEEVTGKTHLKWLEKSQTANLPKYGELTVLPYGFLSQAVNEVLTQDRLAISTALMEALEGKRKTIRQEINIDDHYKLGYNQALEDTLTIINGIFKE